MNPAIFLMLSSLIVFIILMLMAMLGAIVYGEEQVQPMKGPLGRLSALFGPEGPGAWNIIQLPTKLWDPDGTAPYTGAVTGTNGAWRKTTLQFARVTADDIGYIDFTLPPDYNVEANKLHLYLLINANDTTNTHKSRWDGTVRRVPFQKADSDGCALADAAGTALTQVDVLTDDTPNESYAVKLDLSVLNFEPLDWVEVQVFQAVAGCDLGADPYVHNAFALYRR